jgi:hypothetical protein
MNMQILIIVLLAVVVLLIVIPRFSGGRYGSLRPSLETTNRYISFRVNPEMNYYLSGSSVYPNAIIGIDKTWILESDLWKPLDLDPKTLKELIFNIKSQGLGEGEMFYGFEIVDHRGGRIGDWFSLPGQNITVWIKGENRFTLSTPADLSSQK